VRGVPSRAVAHLRRVGLGRACDEPDAERDGAPGLDASPAKENAIERDGFNLHANVGFSGRRVADRPAMQRGRRPGS
jgi:hypothetical protein